MNWTYYLKNAFQKPEDLLDFLKLSIIDFEEQVDLSPSFKFLVPLPFAEKIQKRNPNDPLLRQVLSLEIENITVNGFSGNPVNDNEATKSNLIHKYQNRVLLITSGNCAINCRYCFRKLYDYDAVKFTSDKFRSAKKYILENQAINEVILSGGDPLSLSNKGLSILFKEIESLDQIKFVRIHSRFPVVIPQRLDEELIEIFSSCKKKILFVFHINHPNEIDVTFLKYIKRIEELNIQMLNQSVFLKSINDNPHILYQLSQKIIEAGIMPYYINKLDKVSGSAHFDISIERGKEIISELGKICSGYMIPRFVQDIPENASKTIIL